MSSENESKMSLLGYLMKRERGNNMKMKMSQQLQYFSTGKMTQDTLKEYLSPKTEDIDLVVNKYRMQALQRLTNRRCLFNQVFSLRIYLLQKTVAINEVPVEIMFYYSPDHPMVRGQTVLKEENLLGYGQMTILLISSMISHLTETESELYNFIVIQCENNYNKFGDADFYFLEPNKCATIILPPALFETLKIFKYMDELIDDLEILFEPRQLIDYQNMWTWGTGVHTRIGGKVVRAHFKLLTQEFTDMLQSADSDFNNDKLSAARHAIQAWIQWKNRNIVNS